MNRSLKVKRVTKVIIPIILFGLVSTLVWQQSLKSSTKPTPYPKSTKTFTPILASWLGYSSIEDATDDSQLIMVGEVIKVVSVGTGIFPSTDFEIKINEYIKKPSTFESETIIISQMGSETDTTLMEAKINPLLRVGGTVILFANPALDKNGEETGVYGFRGPWGRYDVIDGKVYSIDNLYPDRFDNTHLDTNVNGQDLSSFISQIKGYISGG